MATEHPLADSIQSNTLDMLGDEGARQGVQKASQLRWDRKKKRFTSGDQVGADNKKMIRSESGALLPASYKSGRFREWQTKQKRSATVTDSGRNVSQNGEANGILPAQAIYRKRQEQAKVRRDALDKPIQ